jgi:hypothetical protein
MVDLEPLNSAQELRKLKLGQHNDLITTPSPRVCNDLKAIYVAERQQAQLNLGLNAQLLSRDIFVYAVLQNVGNNIPVRYHYSFLCFIVSV